MKIFKSRLLTIILVLIFIFSLSMIGCQKEEKKIVIWATSAILGMDEAELPKEEWLFTKLLDEYTKKTGIKFELNLMTNETELQLSIKANALAGTGPDIVNLWTGPYVANLESILLPLNDYMSDYDKQQIIGLDVMTNDLKEPNENNKILGYPFGGNEVCLMLYNKEIIRNCGLDFEKNPPTTVDEFEQSMKIIKENGYLPIIASDWEANSLVNYVFNKWWIQMDGIDNVRAICEGKKKFVDSEAFKETFKKLNQYYELGYINSDYLTFQTADIAFYNGEGAMYPTGNWDVGLAMQELGEDLGILEVPDYSPNSVIPNYITGGNGQSMCILANTKYPKECADFLAWLSNKENSIRLGKHKSVLPLRRDISLEEYGYGENDIEKQIYEMSENLHVWHEYYMDPEVADFYMKFGTSAIIGELSVDDFAKKMDEKVVEIEGKQ